MVIYFAIAITVGALFGGGAGVWVNICFDALIALMPLAAVFISSLSANKAAQWMAVALMLVPAAMSATKFVRT